MKIPMCFRAGLTLLAMGLCVSQGEVIWLEGEAGETALPVSRHGWGQTGHLSGGNWLNLNVDADKVEATLPAEGGIIRWPFTVQEAGRKQVWLRIGYEFARSAFSWRLDDGAWTRVEPETLTEDLQPIEFFCEVAWLRVGEAQLAPGAHTLEVRFQPERNRENKLNRVLFACDAICMAETFRPDGWRRPDDPAARDTRDRAAAAHVFRVPSAAAGERAEVVLKGDWEITRLDEQRPGEVAEPIRDLPDAQAVYHAIAVPGDKNVERPELQLAHRLWYRTRVEVPADMAGRGFYLEFPLNNLNTTVVVNGQLCGFEKNPFCRFQIDVTKAIRPGAVNEILVGIRDAWYGRSANPDDPMKLRRIFNLPIGFFNRGFQDFDYPVWNCPQSGILCTPRFVAAGASAYVKDVFVRPSVEKRTLFVDVTPQGAAPDAVRATFEILDAKTGQTVKKADAPAAAQPAEATARGYAIPWADATLWWPDAPHLYVLRTRLHAADGTVLDTQDTTFGFREWTMDGPLFRLNGVPWRLWADLHGEGATAEEWVASRKASNQRMFRFVTAGQAGSTAHLWFGMEPPETLDFFDREGIVIRRNSTLDGEVIGYSFKEEDAAIREKQGGSEMKAALMRNWRDQCVAQVRGERNHPSIQIWTIENEFAYINLINLLGNSPLMDAYEEEIRKTHDAVRAVDPTRPVMIDGGGALKNQTLSTHGDHYVATLDARYPDLAYEDYPEGGGRGRWQWDGTRPRFIGEDFFSTGKEPADYARWGGEVAFQGKAMLHDAVACCYRMIAEGYRWNGRIAAWHFWTGADGAPEQWLAHAPRAVFTREWNWTFGSGESVQRTYGIFNDTADATPVTFTRKLVFQNKTVFEKTTEHRVAPGMSEKFGEALPMPRLRPGAKRLEGTLELTLSVGGRELFRDTKAVSVLPPAASETRAPAGAIAVWDPQNKVLPHFKRLGVAVQAVPSLTKIPSGTRLLVVGPDALTEELSASSAFAAWAQPGRAVLVLDQTWPLRYQALPAHMELTEPGNTPWEKSASTAFIEDATHPALQGLRDKDFFTWGVGRPVARELYRKPESGAKSLLQTGHRLTQCALAEVPVDKGVLYVSQLNLSAALGSSAVADTLLVRLTDAALRYRAVSRKTAAFTGGDAALQAALDGMGLLCDAAEFPDEALTRAGRGGVAIVKATPQALATLAEKSSLLQAFWKSGGALILCGVDEQGLADFNRVVGYSHVMRPFRRERVAFASPRHPLTAGLSSGALSMLSGQRIFGWQADEYVIDDAFTSIVDLEDMAPFAQSDFSSWGQVVNGFVGEDGWPLIIDFPIPEGDAPWQTTLTLPREESLVRIVYDQSVNYNPTTAFELENADGDKRTFSLKPEGSRQTFEISPPLKGRTFRLRTTAWEKQAGKANNQGIDIIELHAARDEAYRKGVQPLLNIGGLVWYPKGEAGGGVLLCNIRFREQESVPANLGKKRAILASVLRNLKASFASRTTIIAGGRMTGTPIDIHEKATTYKDGRGWFGGGAPTFESLPSGRHTLAGVPYDVYEMETSPVPQVLMLGGAQGPQGLPREILDIPVGRKADALFFLHTAKLTNPGETGAELFRYRIRYADGQSVEVPVCVGQQIGAFVADAPKALPGAALAWSNRAPDGRTLAAYALQWDNPRPDVAIAAVDMVGLQEGRGAPVLLALTAATAATAAP